MRRSNTSAPVHATVVSQTSTPRSIAGSPRLDDRLPAPFGIPARSVVAHDLLTKHQAAPCQRSASDSSPSSACSLPRSFRHIASLYL